MEIMGKRNAAVFPEPVCAVAIISRPLSTIGIEFFCTGVGLLYPAAIKFLNSWECNPDSSQLLMAGGTSSPEVCTGISSYFSKSTTVVGVVNS